MAVATREQRLSLDLTYAGLPCAKVLAKSGLQEDFALEGLPFAPYVDGATAGTPAPLKNVQLWSRRSVLPVTATTLARETGDVLLMEGAFTCIEEDEVLGSNLATIELFIDSTPTAGEWVIGKDYRTGAYTDGTLHSPRPSRPLADDSATLTIVTTTPNTVLSFEWGILGASRDWPLPELYDTLQLFDNDVELVKFIAPMDTYYNDYRAKLKTGKYSTILSAGTHALRWRWHRDTTSTYSTVDHDLAHAWITALIIDPQF